MDANAAGSRSIEARANLGKEISLFLVVLGAIFAALAYFAFTGLRDNPLPLWGQPRYLALGVPLGALAAAHLLAGVLLALTRSPVFAILGALASTLVTVFYVGFMVSATGTVGLNLITGVVIAIPILVWQRTVAFLAAGKQGGVSASE